jgi:hypothetical protein
VKLNEAIGKILKVKNILKMFENHARRSLCRKMGHAQKVDRRESKVKNLKIILNLRSTKSPSKNWDMRMMKLKGGELVKFKRSLKKQGPRLRGQGPSPRTHTLSSMP